MSFLRECEGVPAYAIVEAAGVEPAALLAAEATGAGIEPAKEARDRSSRK